MRSTAVAVGVTAMGVLPSFLVSAFAVQLRDDFAFDAARLGFVVGAFYGVSALGSAIAGRRVEHSGAFRGIALTASCSAVALLVIALFATSWWWVLGALIVAGVGNAVAQPAANLLLAARTPRARQGLLFGIKQAAVPVTTLVGGILVPAVGLTLGWQWAFIGLSLVAVGLIAAAPRGEASGRPSSRPVMGRTPDLGPLLTVTVGGLLGSAAVNSMGVFHVATGVEAGLAPGLAGAMLAVGSVAGIVARITVGWRADLRDGGHLRVVGGLLTVGAVGFVLVGSGAAPWVFVVGTLLAFAAGWGWNGLYTFAVVRRYPQAPASASGISQTGLWVGGLVGPPVFGLLASELSYLTAWGAGAGCLLAAAVLLLVGRRMFLAADARRAQR
ncbi:MFS transporter [Egibacter rhizosphaerae]|uniref:MFS transporter n=1 Tax=Egibacter rhizosphaerae TaxID=1670831 RepID=A0A411YJV8_9ACTN|nr:MFS transporter [Egibacter rhizosphaerae]QBI21484.1 MFS transporter [Egibacter rhizosphaerae]